MANGISKNPLTDIGKVYLTQIAEGRLKSLEKASVLAMSDKPEDQDKAREIKTRYDYQSLMKQKKARKMKEDSDFTEARSDWRTDLREIIVTPDKDSKEPQIKEKKIKNKIQVNPEFKEAVEEFVPSKKRELPQWALNIFSGSMIAAGNVRTDEEAKAIVQLALDNLVVYFDSICDYNNTAKEEDTITAQNYYCHNQQQNPHTPKVMKSLGLNEADVELFCTDALFPKIKTATSIK